jgi:hypothetical protein
MNNPRIIYAEPNGSLTILVPSPDCGLTVEQIAAKDVPAGVPYQIVDASDIPTDRTFRNAWEFSE